MKKLILTLMVVTLMFSWTSSQAFAVNTATHGNISGKSAVSGLASLFIWPGIGQYVNDNQVKKNWTHALIGLFPPFRLWSGWDALIDRQGGRWDGKI